MFYAGEGGCGGGGGGGGDGEGSNKHCLLTFLISTAFTSSRRYLHSGRSERVSKL